MTLIKNNFLNLVKTKEKTMCISISEKHFKLDEKTRRKTVYSINEKLSKLDKKTKRKIDHLLLYSVAL